MVMVIFINSLITDASAFLLDGLLVVIIGLPGGLLGVLSFPLFEIHFRLELAESEEILVAGLRDDAADVANLETKRRS